MSGKAYWTKILLVEDFVSHFYAKSDEEIIKDIKTSIKEIIDYRSSGKITDENTFGSMLLKKAENTIEKYSASNSGKKGGRPKVQATPAESKVVEQKPKPPKVPKVVTPEEQKDAYGEFKNVFLTFEEYDKLMTRFPRDFEKRIENLSQYIASNGYEKKYKNHYATIIKWDEFDKKRDKERAENRPKSFEKQTQEAISEMMWRTEAETLIGLGFEPPESMKTTI